MNTFFLAVIVLMIIATFWWILKPMLDSEIQHDATQLHNQQILEELSLQRESIYAAIKDMELDFESGKISESDFQQGRLRFMQQAAGILKRMDALATDDEQQFDAQIEKLLSSTEINDKMRTDARKNLKIQRASLQDNLTEASPACPKCGKSVYNDDEFCGHCGTSLSLECPACHKNVLDTDKFCPHCGTSIPVQEVA